MQHRVRKWPSPLRKKRCFPCIERLMFTKYKGFGSDTPASCEHRTSYEIFTPFPLERGTPTGTLATLSANAGTSPDRRHRPTPGGSNQPAARARRGGVGGVAGPDPGDGLNRGNQPRLLLRRTIGAEFPPPGKPDSKFFFGRPRKITVLRERSHAIRDTRDAIRTHDSFRSTAIPGQGCNAQRRHAPMSRG